MSRHTTLAFLECGAAAPLSERGEGGGLLEHNDNTRL